MQQPMQSKPHTMQSSHTGHAGLFQGGSYIRQGGGHGHHGQEGLHQQSPSITTRH